MEKSSIQLCINSKKWILGDIISSGDCASVFKVYKEEDLDKKSPYALRVLPDSCVMKEGRKFYGSVPKDIQEEEYKEKINFQKMCSDWKICVPIIDYWYCESEGKKVEIYPLLKESFFNIFTDRHRKDYGYICCIFYQAIYKILNFHIRGYTHNDLHTSNIMVDYKDNVYLIDIDTATKSNDVQEYIVKSISDYQLFHPMDQYSPYMNDIYRSQVVLYRLKSLYQKFSEDMTMDYVINEEKKYIDEFFNQGVIFPREAVGVPRSTIYIIKSSSIGTILKYPSKRFYFEFKWKWPGNNIYDGVFTTTDNLDNIKQNPSFEKYAGSNEIYGNQYTSFFAIPKKAYVFFPKLAINDKYTSKDDKYINFATMKDFLDNTTIQEKQIFWKSFEEFIQNCSETTSEKILYVTSYGLDVPYFYLMASFKKPNRPE